jgi:spore germination cell wall hydrolase CwlJ-like protein
MSFKQIILSVFLSAGLVSAAFASDDPLLREGITSRALYAIPDIPAPTSLKRQDDLTCMAVAIYHEARGEGRKGQLAVASVILRRVEVEGRFGHTVCGVVTQDAAFSFMTSQYGFPPILEEDAWDEALEAADFALTYGGPLRGLEVADHYHTVDSRPYWRKKMNPVMTVGRHHFYADPISLRRNPPIK